MKGDGDLCAAKPALTQNLSSFKLFRLRKCVREQFLKITVKNCPPSWLHKNEVGKELQKRVLFSEIILSLHSRKSYILFFFFFLQLMQSHNV